jgi:glycosyltransferase involved in cell wall biosynthesis
VKILLWHGYLLGGTGSNVYTRSLARAWSRLGHEVIVFCQDPHPDRYEGLERVKVVRPRIDGPLPVFVLDRYEDLESAYLQDLTPAEREHFVELNAAAVREFLPADYIFVNHVLLGAPVGAAIGMPYIVKAHGSELEFSMRGNPDLVAWARTALGTAQEVVVGSEHIREVLEDVVGHVDRVHVVPPGVDVDEFVLLTRDEALQGLIEESRADPPNPGNANERLPDAGNAERLEAFLVDEEPTVLYFGKLLRNKGVHVLFEALREVEARAVVVGFGDYRKELERLAPPRTLFTGPLEHRHLAKLIPLTDVTAVPSIFPEAFGMVAAEAAAAGSLPLVANHSGLAEIAAGVAADYPERYRDLTSFTTGDSAELAEKLRRLLALEPGERTRLQEAARRAVLERWSWAGVARRLLEPVI